MAIRGIILVLMLVPFLVHGAETSVSNDISVSASTGGNSASNGSVSEGTSKSSVQVYTEVNGEVVTDYDETFEGDANVSEEFTHVEEGVESRTSVEIQSDADIEEASVEGTRQVNTTAEIEDESDEEEQLISESVATVADADLPARDAQAGAAFSIRALVMNIFSYVFGFLR